MLYAIPERLQKAAIEHPGNKANGWTLCCPIGHTWHYTGPTPLERERQRADRAEQRAQATRDLLEHEQRSHAATKGHLTRTRKRVAAGVCPCCTRHVTHLERHMTTQQPDSQEAGQ
jgi:hypothetical protein